ncbi:myb/SANT-like DNA-binding domain-containing protein 3 [Zophobas morio]|uniref:myb/SANT-like DNA-binding domain-containing protein 3 n=1 Tax=Zophobas morio TaxID=2755281 RepID=UPI0030831411
MQDLTKRTPNFSAREKITFLDIVERYKATIENKGTSCVINEKKNRAWEKITHEFNAETEVSRTVKHLKLLYANLKRKTRKDVAEEHKEQYLKAKVVDEEDRRELNRTGGGNYKPQLDETGAQILAIIEDQVQPLPNFFDDAANYFHDVPTDIPGCSGTQLRAPTPDLDPGDVPVTQPVPEIRATTSRRTRIRTTRNKKVNYKELYFKKKYQIACFELKSKRQLHVLDLKIKRKELENLNAK